MTMNDNDFGSPDINREVMKFDRALSKLRDDAIAGVKPDNSPEAMHRRGECHSCVAYLVEKYGAEEVQFALDVVLDDAEEVAIVADGRLTAAELREYVELTEWKVDERGRSRLRRLTGPEIERVSILRAKGGLL